MYRYWVTPKRDRTSTSIMVHMFSQDFSGFQLFYRFGGCTHLHVQGQSRAKGAPPRQFSSCCGPGISKILWLMSIEICGCDQPGNSKLLFILAIFQRPCTKAFRNFVFTHSGTQSLIHLRSFTYTTCAYGQSPFRICAKSKPEAFWTTSHSITSTKNEHYNVQMIFVGGLLKVE